MCVCSVQIEFSIFGRDSFILHWSNRSALRFDFPFRSSLTIFPCEWNSGTKSPTFVFFFFRRCHSIVWNWLKGDGETLNCEHKCLHELDNESPLRLDALESFILLFYFIFSLKSAVDHYNLLIVLFPVSWRCFFGPNTCRPTTAQRTIHFQRIENRVSNKNVYVYCVYGRVYEAEKSTDRCVPRRTCLYIFPFMRGVYRAWLYCLEVTKVPNPSSGCGGIRARYIDIYTHRKIESVYHYGGYDKYTI